MGFSCCAPGQPLMYVLSGCAKQPLSSNRILLPLGRDVTVQNPGDSGPKNSAFPACNTEGSVKGVCSTCHEGLKVHFEAVALRANLGDHSVQVNNCHRKHQSIKNNKAFTGKCCLPSILSRTAPYE